MNRTITRITIAAALAGLLALGAVGVTSARSAPQRGILTVDVWEHAVVGDANGDRAVDGADFLVWQRSHRR